MKTQFMRHLYLPLLVILFASFSAQSKPLNFRGIPKVTTFGAEFTFTNAAILKDQEGGATVNSDQSELHRDLMARAALASCDGCKLITKTNAYDVKTIKVLYPDGFYFVIATDPSVVEVQTQPLTVGQIENNQLRMERDLFGAALKVGMQPDKNYGGGHIHFGWLASTRGDLLGTRNIIVDFLNHPELATGIFSTSVVNAPPFNLQPEDRQQAMRQIIADVDSGKIKSVTVLARRIHKEAYDFLRPGYDPAPKYHDLNITRIASDKWADRERTFEMRFLLAQTSPEEYLMQTKLFNGRIEFLKKMNGPIPLDIPKKGFSRQVAYQRFAKYVAESGMDFDEFRNKVALEYPEVAKQTPIYQMAPDELGFFLSCDQVLN